MDWITKANSIPKVFYKSQFVSVQEYFPCCEV